MSLLEETGYVIIGTNVDETHTCSRQWSLIRLDHETEDHLITHNFTVRPSVSYYTNEVVYEHSTKFHRFTHSPANSAIISTLSYIRSNLRLKSPRVLDPNDKNCSRVQCPITISTTATEYLALLRFRVNFSATVWKRRAGSKRLFKPIKPYHDAAAERACISFVFLSICPSDSVINNNLIRRHQ